MKTQQIYLAYPIDGGSPGGDDEHRGIEWLPSDQAHQRLTYDADRKVLSSALRMIEQNLLYQQMITTAAAG